MTDTIKTLIENIRTDNSQDFIKALKFGKDLSLLDIPFKTGQSINERSFEKELTIYLNPLVDGRTDSSIKRLTQFLGYQSGHINTYKKEAESNSFPINAKEFGYNQSKIIGHYLKDRNILYIGISPTLADTYSWCIFKLYDAIKSLLKQTTLETVCVKKMQMKILSKKFFDSIDSRMNDYDNQIKNRNSSIEDYERTIMIYLEEIRNATIQLEALKSGSDDRENLFLNELAKLDKLSYLDKWEIDGTDLVFHFSNVHAMFGGDNIYLGEYAVKLLADGRFEWICHNPIKALSSSYEGDTLLHPHISGDSRYSQCWGKKGADVQRAVSQGNYSVVVSYINMFLRSYNDGSPHRRIKLWKEYNEKFNRSHENQNGDKK